MKYYIHMLILWCFAVIGQRSPDPALVKKAQEIQCKMFDEDIKAIKIDIQNRLVKSLKTSKWNPFVRRRREKLKGEVESLQAQLEQMKRDRQLKCPAVLNE